MAHEKLELTVGILGAWLFAAYRIVTLPQYFPAPSDLYWLITITAIAVIGVCYILLPSQKKETTPIPVEVVKLPETSPKEETPVVQGIASTNRVTETILIECSICHTRFPTNVTYPRAATVTIGIIAKCPNCGNQQTFKFRKRIASIGHFS